jgi:hypothetical protein
MVECEPSSPSPDESSPRLEIVSVVAVENLHDFSCVGGAVFENVVETPIYLDLVPYPIPRFFTVRSWSACRKAPSAS